MRKYLELFINGFDETITDKIKVENKPYIGYSMGESKVVYTVIPKPADPNTYVTFTAEADNSSIGLAKLSTNQSLEYSTDTTTWNNFDTTTNIPLNNGDKVYVRGILSSDNDYNNYTQFKMSGKIAASGNCNALWNYEDLEVPLKKYCGYRMFSYCTSLTTAPELPATTLAEFCYTYMFAGSTSLATAPELPATTLANSCYQDMFEGCTSLTTATPELPATTLVNNCYFNMFSYCTSLTTAPELPATVLAERCYYSMFANCTSLTTAPELPATVLAESCYYNMFKDCTSLTIAPKILPATTLAGSCYCNMFRNCSSLTTAPELPATTLAKRCYEYMFYNCISLTTAPELPATTLVERCYSDMLSDCPKLNHIKCLATDISAASCTTNWVYRVSSSGTFVKHPDMTSWSTGNNGIPRGWTVIDAEL